MGYNSSELQRKPEWWHIDLSYVSGEHQDESSSGYFFNLPIMIEHENGDNPEEEMYNLIFHRSPLKVIIFRDYNDDDRERNEKYRDWLNGKLQLFLDFLKTANEIHEEAESARYLFIVWARELGDGPVYWRWASDQSIVPKRWER
jgi:hypothetical protein